MLPSLTFAPRAGLRRPSRLLVLVLTVMPAFAPCTFPAQTANPQEISTRDVKPTFKLQAERNLVMVRVVVRDAKGATVDNLRQEDFQLFDHGKLQTILHFSLEKPALKATEKTAATEPQVAAGTTVPTSAARRFVALYFDDVNTTFADLARARDAADNFLAGSVQPGDRVALYTSSGQKQVEFTGDLAQVHQALFDLRPRPLAGQNRSCDAVLPYEAYLIVENDDPSVIAVVTNEILNCDFQGKSQYSTQARNMVRGLAITALSQFEAQSAAALRGIESVIRHLRSLPGQRSVIIISGGFLTETLHFELGQLADLALRGGVTLNAIDARGVYTDLDVARLDTTTPLLPRPSLMLRESARTQTDGMQSLALDTGGVFFNNSNDLKAGFRKAADLPEAFYVLAFSPQNLKLDGAFHPLQVKLVSHKGLLVQARRGYYSPKKPNDPAEQEKEEIQEAVLSQDETQTLPMDVHTQFFMKTESEARITVLTRLDLHPLHFRKEGDLNLANLTFVTVVFDLNGQMVSGQQKAVRLRLQDSNLEKYLQTGITIRTLLDVKPGAYSVRAIVRDSESGQISGLNRTVEIP